MATIRITSVNYNNQGANITFYSENNPNVPINLGLNTIPYNRTGNDVFGRYVLSFPSFGSVCEASIASPTTTTTTTTGTGTTTTGTTPVPSDFILEYMPDFNMTINIGSVGNGIVNFNDNDFRTYSNNSTLTKNAIAWSPRAGFQSWIGVASSSDGTKLVAVVSGGQIYTSTDSGVSWTARESNRNWTGVASSSDGTKLVAVVSNGFLYTSTDSGVSWTNTNFTRNWIRVASSSDGTKLVAVVPNGQIHTSTDSGVNWMMRESNRNWYSVASSSDGTKLVAVVIGGKIYTSTDSGVNWTARESDRSWIGVASSSDGTKLVAVVSGGQIYTSTDSGVSWTARESDRNWYSVASNSDGTKLVAVVRNGKIYTSTDSGVNWTARENDRNWIGVASSSDGTKLVAVVGGEQIYTNMAYSTMTISGPYNRITFVNNSLTNNQNLGITSVTNWGNLVNIENMFSNIFGSTSFGADNLVSFPANISPTLANGAFDNCDKLNVDLTGFNLVNLASNNLNTFMRNVTLSNDNYNKALVYWNTNKNSYPFNNIIIHMGNSKADATSGGVNGIAAKLALLNHGWTITDGS